MTDKIQTVKWWCASCGTYCMVGSFHCCGRNGYFPEPVALPSVASDKPDKLQDVVENFITKHQCISPRSNTIDVYDLRAFLAQYVLCEPKEHECPHCDGDGWVHKSPNDGTQYTCEFCKGCAVLHAPAKEAAPK